MEQCRRSTARTLQTSVSDVQVLVIKAMPMVMVLPFLRIDHDQIGSRQIDLREGTQKKLVQKNSDIL